MLGMSSTIKRTGAYSDVTSSCIRGNMMNNVTYGDDHWDKADPVNVTFYGDWTREDKKSVLIYNNGMYSPLSQLAYIKFIAMFYGAEELANRVYDEIANKRFGPKQVNLQANSDASEFAKQTWAIIDTTQYSQLPGKQAPKQSPSSERVDENSYTQRSGASSNSFAVKKNNVYLTDKATNRNLRHSEFSPGPLVLEHALLMPRRLFRSELGAAGPGAARCHFHRCAFTRPRLRDFIHSQR